MVKRVKFRCSWDVLVIHRTEHISANADWILAGNYSPDSDWPRGKTVRACLLFFWTTLLAHLAACPVPLNQAHGRPKTRLPHPAAMHASSHEMSLFCLMYVWYEYHPHHTWHPHLHGPGRADANPGRTQNSWIFMYLIYEFYFWSSSRWAQLSFVIKFGLIPLQKTRLLVRAIWI